MQVLIFELVMANEAASEEPTQYISTLDLFLLSAVVGFAVYWFFFRKDEKPSDDEFKQMTVV